MKRHPLQKMIITSCIMALALTTLTASDDEDTRKKGHLPVRTKHYITNGIKTLMATLAFAPILFPEPSGNTPNARYAYYAKTLYASLLLGLNTVGLVDAPSTFKSLKVLAYALTFAPALFKDRHGPYATATKILQACLLVGGSGYLFLFEAPPAETTATKTPAAACATPPASTPPLLDSTRTLATDLLPELIAAPRLSDKQIETLQSQAQALQKRQEHMIAQHQAQGNDPMTNPTIIELDKKLRLINNQLQEWGIVPKVVSALPRVRGR